MSRRSAVRAILGIGISVVAVAILLRSVDVGAALNVLGGADSAAVALMFGTVLLDVAARGARWRALLLPIKRITYP